jgi:hypothetical protein
VEIRNVRSYPLVIGGTVVQPGETITVPDDLGSRLCDQPANWQVETIPTRPDTRARRRTSPTTELVDAPAEPDPTTNEE